MQEHERLNDEERQTQRLLSGLRPLRPELSATDVLLEMERRRARRQLWSWCAIAACLGAGLALSVLLRPQAGQTNLHAPDVQQTLAKPLTVSPPDESQNAIRLAADAASLTGNGYLARRNRVLVLGLSGLVTVPPAPALRPVSSAAPTDMPAASPLLKFIEPLVNGGRL